MIMSGSKPILVVPDTRRARSVSPVPRQLASSVIALFEGRSTSMNHEQDGEKDALLPPSRFDQTDFASEKTSGKRRHSTKLPSRHGSFRSSKKLRQEHSLGDIGQITHSPVFRHKQQASISSTIPLLPLWNRLRNFGHHDLQSAILERLGPEKGSESERAMRKKPTGASAAHTSSSETAGCNVETRENDLVASCPAFRNEVGGDYDWADVSDKDNPLLKLRGSLSLDKQKRVGSRAKMILEGSVPSKDIMQHKSAMGRQMKIVLQQQTSVQCPFEFIDYGALYYRNHFYQQGTVYTCSVCSLVALCVSVSVSVSVSV